MRIMQKLDMKLNQPNQKLNKQNQRMEKMLGPGRGDVFRSGGASWRR